MRGEQNQSADPYRTLGLEPGASMAEVKRAYRLLAKAFHPDSAGETALPRFLAIHEAYEQLKSGRAPSVPRAGRAPAAAPPADPWRADPARARAARERARTGRGRPGAGASAAGAPGAPGAAGASGASGGKGAAPGGGSGRSHGRPTSTSAGGTSSRAGRRQVRKATMGSTSYDDARDHADATWSGASWYGPSTGEYWIVNPREYADPRKHGPEYQSRTRRAADGLAFEAASTADAVGAAPAMGSATAGQSATAAGSGAASASGTASDPAATRRARGAQAATRSSWAPPTAGRAWRSDAAAPRPGEAPFDGDPLAAFETASRRWLGGPADDPIRRLGLALVAWPPIGLAAAALIGDITGCSVSSASCGGSDSLLPWLAQAGILGLLLLLPPLTRVFAGGAIAILLALVPITFFLIAIGGTGAPQAGFVMFVLLGVAWFVGVAVATRASVRRTAAARAGP